MPTRLQILEEAVNEHQRELLLRVNGVPTIEGTSDPLPSAAANGGAFRYDAPYDQMTDPTILPGDACHISLRAIGDGQDA